MAKNGEPILTHSEISSIIKSSDAIVASADPSYFEAESKLTKIKQKLAQDEAEREARVSERLETSRKLAKKNTSLYMEDIGL